MALVLHMYFNSPYHGFRAYFVRRFILNADNDAETYQHCEELARERERSLVKGSNSHSVTSSVKNAVIVLIVGVTVVNCLIY